MFIAALKPFASFNRQSLSNSVLYRAMANNRGKQLMNLLGANGNNGEAPVSVFNSAVGDKKRFATSNDNSNVESEQRKKTASSGRVVQQTSTAPRPTSVPSGSLNVDAILAANGVSEVPAESNNGNRSKKNNNRNNKSQGHAKNVTAHHGSAPMAVDPPVSATEEKPAYLTDHTFQNLNISPNTIRAIAEVMKFK